MSASKLLVMLCAFCASGIALAEKPIDKIKKPQFFMVDSSKNVVGPMVQPNGMHSGLIAISGNGQVAWLLANANGFVNVDGNVAPSPPEVNPGRYPPQGVLFDLPDCRGTPYMRPWDNDAYEPPMQPVHAAVGDLIAYAYDVSGFSDPAQQVDLGVMQSTLLFDGTCEQGVVPPSTGFGLHSYALPAIRVTDLRRFIPPFRFEIR